MFIAFFVITAINLGLALGGWIYPETDKWGVFMGVEIAAFWTFFIIGFGFEYGGFALITLINVIYLAAADNQYAWQIFGAVEFYACLLLLTGLYKSSKRTKQEKTEQARKDQLQKRLELESREIIAIISEIVSSDIYANRAAFNTTHHQLVLKLDTKTLGNESFKCELPVKVHYLDLPAFRPGNRVRIRYVPDEPTICEFVEALDNQQPSSAPVQNAKQLQPVICPFCQTHFDLSESKACPNCRAPYVN